MSLRTRRGVKGILVSLLVVAAIFLFHSCHVARYVFWNYADVGDAVKFPSVPVKNDPAHPSPIPSVPSRNLDVPRGFNDTASPLPFREFLEKNYTLSFLVVRNDTLIYSYYRTGYDSASLLPSFSVAKSFVSALTGIALAEGYLKNVRQTVTDLLPEIRDPGFRKVTIQDLLTMRSGIRFNEGYTDPFSEMAKFYYGLNLRKYTLKLKTRIPPDSLYEYQSGNAEILGMILERVTGRSLAAYLEEKIWIPMGMEGEATWNTDSKKHMEIKSFCCINARAVDFAKFGMLYLHQGYWNGMPVVPEKWVKESLMIRNDSRDSQGYPYGYMWRTLEDGSFFAKGILGQYIFVDPARRLVIVHCGMKAGNVNWVEFFRSLARQFS